MPHNIIIGRDEEDKKRFGEKGCIYLGRHYVKMGQVTSISNKVLMDIARAHVVMVDGKRGSGKSYSLSVMAEEMARLPEEIKQNLAFLFLDTMGIFWTMKFPNTRQEKLLEKWDLKPEAQDINIFTPTGYYEQYKKGGIPTDFSFSIKPVELSAIDWVNVFEVKLTDAIGILIERIIEKINVKKKNYSIEEIIEEIRKDKRAEQKVKDATENRFLAASKWGLFSEKGTAIKDLIRAGEISVLDVSCYKDWNIKCLVIGIIARKLLSERITARKLEEIETIKKGTRYFEAEEEKKKEMPLVWILIDEGHIFLPRIGKTPATDALVSLLREGRQPGISLVLATQQPGEIHKDVLTQSDIVISHRITSRLDIEALNSMMQTYLITDIQSYLNNLPKLKGSAIILDDNSERIYPMRVHPKRSWHGGEAPTAIKEKRKLELEI